MSDTPRTQAEINAAKDHIKTMNDRLDVFNKGKFKDADALAAHTLDLRERIATTEAERDAANACLREVRDLVATYAGVVIRRAVVNLIDAHLREKT